MPTFNWVFENQLSASGILTTSSSYNRAKTIWKQTKKVPNRSIYVVIRLYIYNLYLFSDQYLIPNALIPSFLNLCVVRCGDMDWTISHTHLYIRAPYNLVISNYKNRTNKILIFIYRIVLYPVFYEYKNVQLKN